MPVIFRIRDLGLPRYIGMGPNIGMGPTRKAERRAERVERNLTRGLDCNLLRRDRLTHKPDRDGCRQ